MFDGLPSELTSARVRDIYGVSEDEFEETADLSAAQPAAKPGLIVGATTVLA